MCYSAISEITTGVSEVEIGVAVISTNSGTQEFKTGLSSIPICSSYVCPFISLSVVFEFSSMILGMSVISVGISFLSEECF